MGELVVVENVTLDGVLQAPGGADEDERGGFRHGGWARPYADAVMAETMGRGMGANSALLLGRRTYTQFHGFWAQQTDGNPYTEVLDRKTKYVVSQTLAEPLPWANSTLLPGDPAASVAALKREVDADLVVLGSGQLVRALLSAHLVDVLVLSVHPLVLGTGTRLFAEGSDAAAEAHGALALVEAVPTTTGVVIATYRVSTREGAPGGRIRP